MVEKSDDEGSWSKRSILKPTLTHLGLAHAGTVVLSGGQAVEVAQLWFEHLWNLLLLYHWYHAISIGIKRHQWILVDISGHWLTHVCVFEDQLTVPWRSLKCHSVAFSSCKKVRETISALTSTPWAMTHPTNSCMRRIVCHSRPRTPTIAHQELQHFCQENLSIHGFPTASTWFEFKWVSWCWTQCFDLRVLRNAQCEFFKLSFRHGR